MSCPEAKIYHGSCTSTPSGLQGKKSPRAQHCGAGAQPARLPPSLLLCPAVPTPSQSGLNMTSSHSPITLSVSPARAALTGLRHPEHPTRLSQTNISMTPSRMNPIRDASSFPKLPQPAGRPGNILTPILVLSLCSLSPMTKLPSWG